MQLTRVGIIASMFGALVLSAAPAAAQNSRSFQVERFEPMHAQGINILNLATSGVLPHQSPTAGLFLHFVGDPLVQRDANDEVVGRLLDNQLKAEFSAGIGLFDMFDLGFVFPVILTQTGDDLALFGDPNDTVSSAGLGDLRIVPKVRVLDPEIASGFGIAIIPTVILPTGGRKSFNSDGKFRFEPRLAVDWTHDDGYQVVANVAYSFRPKRPAAAYISDDSFRWAFGGYVPIPIPEMDGLGAVASLFGDAPLNGDLSRDGFNAPVEVDLGLQYDLPYNLVANLGGGTGLTDGVGSPSFRIFGSISYTPRVKDSDGDGIYDDVDACPQDPEDFDDFEDSDGCPDHDNDQDGILDTDDQCPNDPEDIDGFEDENGCPDIDNDQDTVLDVDDKCPDVAGPVERQGCPEGDRDGDGIGDDTDQCPDDPEDKDGFEDEDGCPDLDNDQDGLLDVEDQCPNEPEDIDGFQDSDGCPDPDNDQDKILDVDDQCPLQPETYNGKDDEDGCPEDVKVRVTRTKVEILEKVFFDTGKATIQKRSFGLLSEVAGVLLQNPQITKLRVEGHTDDRGKDDYNQKLSEDRAAAVKTYLTEVGKVEPGRLESAGYGETRPIADNTKSAGRGQNRRVEFVIISIDGKPVETKEAVIETTETTIDGEKVAPKKEAPKKEAPKKEAPKTEQKPAPGIEIEGE